MKKPPEGYPRITSSVFYEDAHEAIDWLCRVLGFEIRLKVEGEGGRIAYSEVTFAGDGLISVHSPGGEHRRSSASPRAVGGANTQWLCMYLDDVDGHYERAKAQGAKIIEPPKTSDYGDEYWSDRSYGVEDPEGHHWWFVQRIREQKPR
ncbi:MAG TPA: VOC family protein [Polyangiales bacterium]|nr:VOC family protein [Polyangiales bacterium]